MEPLKNLQITCSSCNHENELPIDKYVRCSNCSKRLFSWKIELKNFASGVVMLTLSFFGGQYYEDYKSPETRYLSNNYSIGSIYSIIDTCTNSDSIFMWKAVYRLKRQICICALDACQDKYRYGELEKNAKLFSYELVKCRAKYTLPGLKMF